MREFETRIIDIDVEKVRKIMKEIGAENVKRENQRNDIFDFPDRNLLAKKGYARIRTVEDLLNNKTVYFMTTKKCLVKIHLKLWKKMKQL